VQLRGEAPRGVGDEHVGAARAAPRASNTTAPGSPESCAITGTPLRLPQMTSCSRAAARKVSPAASITLAPCDCSHFASLPIEVVFPEPFTPAIMMTKGRAPFTSSRFSKGARSAAMSSFSARLSASPSGTFFLRSEATSACVAGTPQSACSRAFSSSSNSASSTLRRTKSSETGVLRTSRVRARPALRRAAQERATIDA
jgi:hypothetical protein